MPAERGAFFLDTNGLVYSFSRTDVAKGKAGATEQGGVLPERGAS
jgi:hypothetical protein